MSFLEVCNLVKIYKSRKVVSNVSFKINSGEVVGLLGPNGAGKTTCFYMVIGMIPASSGNIFFNGIDITKLPIHKRSQMGIGYLPQESSIFRKLSAEDNIKAILEIRSDLSHAQKKSKLSDLMDSFNIHSFKDVLGLRLSGGERRRVEIARTLAISPKFILMDEPFVGIDPISITDTKNIILRLKKSGIGILITDHNVREVLDICDRVYIIYDSSVIASGSADCILENRQVKSVYLGDMFK